MKNLAILDWTETNHFGILKKACFVGKEFDSNISQVSMYNRALSQQEILQNFNATRFRYGI